MNTELYQKIIEQDDFKSVSILQGISATDADFFNLKALLERVEYNQEFSEIDFSVKDDSAEMSLVYQGEKYKINLEIENPAISNMFTLSHDLSPTELKRLQNAGFGLTVKMFFGKNNLTSFHFQVKLIYSILPNIAGIVDYCSYSILSGRWVKLAAGSKVLPSPSYLYRTHAVNDKEDVWMHTHGLNRCGSVELEIIGASTQNESYQALSPIIDALAAMAITDGTTNPPKEPIFIGDGIVVTWVKWEEAIEGLNNQGCSDDDRKDHDSPSGVLYLYKSEKDYNKGVLSHLNEAVPQLQENPLFFFSNEETNRMRSLAHERLKYVYELTFKDNNKTLLKAGIEVDAEHKQEDEANMEHLWFEVVDINKNRFTAILLNQPYYISRMNEGDQIDIHENEITDWVIYTQEHRINPDNVYLIENNSALSYETQSNRDKLLEQLELWHETNQPNEVIEACLQIGDLDYELTSSYARALNNIGDYKGAIEQLMKVKEEGEDDSRWHYKLAYAYDSLEEYDKAIECLKKSLELDDTYAPAWMQLGYVYNNLKQYQKAIDAFEKGFEVDPDDYHHSKSDKEHFRSIVEDCKKSLEREKKFDLFKQLKELSEKGQYAEVIKGLDEAGELDYHFKLMKIDALIGIAKFDEAHSQLLDIKEQGEEHSTWQLYLSKTLEGKGKLDEAKLAKEKFTELKKEEDKYVRIITTDDYISVPFYIEKDKVFAIGEKINKIDEAAYMNGYNWEALLRYYIGRHYPEIEEHLKHDPEAGMYVGYFKNTKENEALANKLVEIITDLVENEDKLYDLVRHEGTNIEWD
jgi:tetratricopeptide (TPR) repeat protein